MGFKQNKSVTGVEDLMAIDVSSGMICAHTVLIKGFEGDHLYSAGLFEKNVEWCGRGKIIWVSDNEQAIVHLLGGAQFSLNYSGLFGDCPGIFHFMTLRRIEPWKVLLRRSKAICGNARRFLSGILGTRSFRAILL